MKTIENVAFDRYLSDQSLPRHKRMGDSNYIDWAVFGAREAQRYIPMEEELPEHKVRVLVKDIHEAEFTFIFTGSCDIKESAKLMGITHWRPLYRS